MKDRLKGRKTLKVTNFLDDFEKDEIKRLVDIVELFESFGVKLSKKGKSYMGLCPWHDDKNPSLSVDGEQKIFHCFGCGKSGDVFKVVEFMRGVPFKEALAYLRNNEVKGKSLKLKEREEGKSEKLKVESEKLREEKKDEREEGVERLKLKVERKEISKEEKEKQISEITEISLTTIAEYYHKKLYDNPKAVEFLKRRGFTNLQNYSRFRIGFCDGSLTGILSQAQKGELIKLGILNEKGREHFLNHLIYPIFDDIGNVTGMYGRSIY